MHSLDYAPATFLLVPQNGRIQSFQMLRGTSKSMSEAGRQFDNGDVVSCKQPELSVMPAQEAVCTSLSPRVVNLTDSPTEYCWLSARLMVVNRSAIMFHSRALTSRQVESGERVIALLD